MKRRELVAQRWSEVQEPGRRLSDVLSIGAFAFVSVTGDGSRISPPLASGRPVGAEGGADRESLDPTSHCGPSKQFARRRWRTPVVVPVKVRVASTPPGNARPSPSQPDRSPARAEWMASWRLRGDGPSTKRHRSPCRRRMPDETASDRHSPAPARAAPPRAPSPSSAVPESSARPRQRLPGRQRLRRAAPSMRSAVAANSPGSESCLLPAKPRRLPRLARPRASVAAERVGSPAYGVTGARSINLNVPADVRIRGRDSFQIGSDVYRLDGLSSGRAEPCSRTPTRPAQRHCGADAELQERQERRRPDRRDVHEGRGAASS